MDSDFDYEAEKLKELHRKHRRARLRKKAKFEGTCRHEYPRHKNRFHIYQIAIYSTNVYWSMLHPIRNTRAYRDGVKQIINEQMDMMEEDHD